MAYRHAGGVSFFFKTNILIYSNSCKFPLQNGVEELICDLCLYYVSESILFLLNLL